MEQIVGGIMVAAFESPDESQCLKEYVQLAIQEGCGSPITCPDMVACLVPVDQFEFYKRLKFERGANLLVSITFIFKVSVEAAVLHTAKTKPVGLWATLSDCVPEAPSSFPQRTHPGTLKVIVVLVELDKARLEQEAGAGYT
ncbi:hypothetical protein llap_15713 [Limosa lapponica baueri]|uniref:Uncharacterized protein n=1 Tax=Limosa lapponica baueri TaxID=1758121 RepID=A0A2I0TJQ1_LIMLA|nr:hypothetical protein llap_15713 [Limosa lapponica baueri]